MEAWQIGKRVSISLLFGKEQEVNSYKCAQNGYALISGYALIWICFNFKDCGPGIGNLGSPSSCGTPITISASQQGQQRSGVMEAEVQQHLEFAIPTETNNFITLEPS